MVVVYVKHYLNPEGIKYFDETWFPYVKSIEEQQPGYRGIETSKQADDPECVNITVKFEDQKTWDDWIAHPLHQEVINDLDQYRTRPWRWLKNEGEPAPEDIGEWNEVAL